MNHSTLYDFEENLRLESVTLVRLQNYNLVKSKFLLLICYIAAFGIGASME